MPDRSAASVEFGAGRVAGARALAWGVFALHLLGLLLIHPPFGAWFDAEPLVEQDYGTHLHHLHAVHALARETGRLWGYSAAFMAGHPVGTIQDASIKLFELALLPFPASAIDRLFKLLVLAAAAAAPWMIWGTARLLLGRGWAPSIASALATAAWWNSLPREMLFYGMIGFASVAHFTFLALALAIVVVESGGEKGKRRWGAHIGWIVCAALLPPMHVMGVAIAFLPALAYVILRFRAWSRIGPAWIGLGVFLGLAVNAPWLLAFFDRRGDDISSSLVEALPAFVSDDPWTFVRDYLHPDWGVWTFRFGPLEKGFRLALLGIGVAGVAGLWRSGRRAIAATLGAAIGWLFFLAYFGSLVPALRAWQPLRFKAPLDAALALGAAAWIVEARTQSIGGRGRIVGFSALAIGFASFLVNLYFTETGGALTMRSGLPERERRIVEWIAREAPPEGRVLFEESGDESGFVYDGVYLSSFAARMTGRAFIGGPANLYNDRHHRAHFHSGRLFGEPIATASDARLIEILDLYNIGAIVAFAPPSIARFLSLGDRIELAGQFGPIVVMRARRPLSWFLKGSGRVSVGVNAIRLMEIEGDDAVIKFHWVEGLASDPPARIEPYPIPGDPIPFIRLIDPPEEVTLRVR
jgi:hypothetical protein